MLKTKILAGKRYPKTLKKEKIIKLIIYLLLGGVIFFSIFLVVKSFVQKKWDGKHQLNLVIQGKKIGILSYRPSEKILNILFIPENSYIEVAGDLGKYPLQNIYKLGEERKFGGGRLLLASLQQFLAIPLDGYIFLETEKDEICNIEVLAQGKSFLLIKKMINGKLKTDLTEFDLIRIFWILGRLRAEQIKSVNFEKTQLVEKKQLPDNSIIYETDYSQIDKLSQEIFGDKEALKEGLTLKIMNATSYKETSLFWLLRLFKNFGVEVVGGQEITAPQADSVLYYKNEKVRKSYTFQKIKKVFNIQKVGKKEDLETEAAFLLGKDFNIVWQKVGK